MQGAAAKGSSQGILRKSTGKREGRKSLTGRKSAKLKARKSTKTPSKQIDKIMKEKRGTLTPDDTEPTDKGQVITKGKSFQKRGIKRKFEGAKDKGDKRPALESMSYKERKGIRRKTKNNYEIASNAKKIWEQVRDSKCPAEKRIALVSELCELIKSQVPDLVFAHDTVRVIQCCIQYGTEEQRKAIFEEIRNKVVKMCKSKFGKHSVIKMLRYGTKEQKHHIIASFYGKVCQLVRNKDAAEVVEESYNNFANAQQRSALMEEFYGPRFAIFKEAGVQTLGAILEKNPEMKPEIIEHMLKLLTPLIDKSVVKHSIVHKALLDFMLYANNAKRAELIEGLRDVVVRILHTQDGAKAAMYSLWFGTAKDRKIIIKSFKTFLSKICMEEFGHRVLFALFDCVDDTKLVEKAIINEIMSNCKEIAEDPHGKKVILYMLAPRDPGHFHPDIVKLLERGDGNPVSKKDTETRQREIRDAASKPLMEMVVENLGELLFDKSHSQLVLSILQHATGDKTEAYEAIASFAAEEFCPVFTDSRESAVEMHIVEHPSGHLLLKRLIQHEKSLDAQAFTDLHRFSDVLVEKVPAANLQSWTKVNRGNLVLLSLYENGSDAAKEQVKMAIDLKLLEKKDSKGAKALLEKLKE